jgi:CRISPR/Cas system CSM-associated protein Csm2 small subunit
MTISPEQKKFYQQKWQAEKIISDPTQKVQIKSCVNYFLNRTLEQNEQIKGMQEQLQAISHTCQEYGRELDALEKFKDVLDKLKELMGGK